MKKLLLGIVLLGGLFLGVQDVHAQSCTNFGTGETGNCSISGSCLSGQDEGVDTAACGMNPCCYVPTGGASATSGDACGEEIAGVCIPTGTGLAGDTGETVESTITNFMQWVLKIFASLAIIAFVIAGIMYLMSSGDDRKMEDAKKAMIYSIIGVVVALGALVILTAVDAWLGGSSTF